MGATAAPPPEVDLDAGLVRELLLDQHGDLAELPIRLHAEGWDNALFRVGDDLMVRLPRRAVAAQLIVNEMTWLPRIADRLPLDVPVPVRVGRPTTRFPWNWTVVPWFDGHPIGTRRLADGQRSARVMGTFLAALHRPAPPAAPHNPLRGGPLTDRVEALEDRLTRLPAAVDIRRVRAAFDRALASPAWDGPPVWLHGDLHPYNVLQQDGEIVAVIDFGDITAGDPATDLMVAWSLFDAAERAELRRAADTSERPIDDHTWERGRGWAIAHSVAIIASGAGSAWQTDVGLRTLTASLG